MNVFIALQENLERATARGGCRQRVTRGRIFSLEGNCGQVFAKGWKNIAIVTRGEREIHTLYVRSRQIGCCRYQRTTCPPLPLTTGFESRHIVNGTSTRRTDEESYLESTDEQTTTSEGRFSV